LSQIAQNFDEYEFVQMIWEYRSTTTDIGASTTGQCGTIIMCTNYNSSAGPFTDKGVMMEYAHAHSCKVTEHMVHGVECDPTKNAMSAILFTRASPVVTGQDLKTYDLGSFQLAIANSPAAYANLPLGELWVEYSCRLRKPKLFASRGLDCDRDMWYMSTAVSGTLSWANQFGSATSSVFLKGQQNNIGCLFQPHTTYASTGTSTANLTVTSSSNSGFSILIPGSYNGNLRLTVTSLGTITTAGTNGSYLLFGNIQPIADLYASPGNAGAAVSTTFSSNSTQAGAASFTQVLDLYVRQATGLAFSTQPTFDGQLPNVPSSSAANYFSGGNNIISFAPSGSGNTGTITQTIISIEQYQPMGGIVGMTGVNSVMGWVNSAGTVVIPT